MRILPLFLECMALGIVGLVMRALVLLALMLLVRLIVGGTRGGHVSLIVARAAPSGLSWESRFTGGVVRAV